MMEPKRRMSLATQMLALAAMLLAVGCNTAEKAVTRPLLGQRLGEAKMATRQELLMKLEQDMGRLWTLMSNVNLEISKQDVLVPAALKDYPRMVAGKDYNKRFLTIDANSRMYISRAPDGTRKVRFSGSVVGPTASFMLLGLNDDFWVMLPNTEERKAGEKGPENVVYIGSEDRGLLRPEEVFTIRPQDVVDLLLYDEVFHTQEETWISYMETWPDFYILNFIRPDWPEHIASRIWFERRSLTPAIHQLFDGAGNVIAEGRFGNFRAVKGKNSELEVQLPYEIDLLWPRDLIVMKLTLANVQINEQMDSKVFQPAFGDARRIEVPKGRDPRSAALESPSRTSGSAPR